MSNICEVLTNTTADESPQWHRVTLSCQHPFASLHNYILNRQLAIIFFENINSYSRVVHQRVLKWRNYQSDVNSMCKNNIHNSSSLLPNHVLLGIVFFVHNITVRLLEEYHYSSSYMIFDQPFQLIPPLLDRYPECILLFK